MVDINDVASLAGVSTATVSRTLSGKNTVSNSTRSKVLRAAGELGYVVSSTASSLSSGRTKNVGIVLPFLNRWYFSSVVDGAEAALRRHGYDLTLYNLRGGAESRSHVFTHFLHRKRIDALIAVALELADEEVKSLLALGKPIVGIGGPIAGVTTLNLNNVEVARLGTAHLIELGHTDIAYIGSPADLGAAFRLGENRFQGFEKAMSGAGLPIHEKSFQPADFSVRSGYDAGQRLLADARWCPTAVFAASDEMAIGCILAAREFGLTIPEDLSIVGVDDHELAPMFGLTTIAQHPRNQGEQAVEVLMHQLLQTETPGDARTIVDFELITRSSTGKPARRSS